MNIPIYLKPLAEEAKKHNNANGFIEALEQRIHREELGCIWSKWIRLPGLPLMCMGENKTPDKEIIQRAISQYKSRYNKRKIDNKLSSKYPYKQLYESMLPESDVEFTGDPGLYIYVLKTRRRHGKYQVQEAIMVSCKSDEPLDLEKFWKEVKEDSK